MDNKLQVNMNFKILCTFCDHSLLVHYEVLVYFYAGIQHK